MIRNVISIEDMIGQYGEDITQEILAGFSCKRNGKQLNVEVETFVHKNAIDFYKRKLAVTYLVFDENDEFAAVYALSHKAVDISTERISKGLAKRISRYARLDTERNVYTVSAFLIAQFGKNFAVTDGKTVSGNELMDNTLDMLMSAQSIVGGGLVFLDCEKDNNHALDLYKEYGFVPFGERLSESDGQSYIQLLKFF